jgi:hypothetical protein
MGPLPTHQPPPGRFVCTGCCQTVSARRHRPTSPPPPPSPTPPPPLAPHPTPQFIARHLPPDEVAAFEVLFDSLDVRHAGALTAEDLAAALVARGATGAAEAGELRELLGLAVS